MKFLIIIVIAFLILVYAYTYIKYKKRKSNYIDTVSDFRKKYLKGDNISRQKKTNITSNYQKYITKYNSSLDYVEKDKFLNS